MCAHVQYDLLVRAQPIIEEIIRVRQAAATPAGQVVSEILFELEAHLWRSVPALPVRHGGYTPAQKHLFKVTICNNLCHIALTRYVCYLHLTF